MDVLSLLRLLTRHWRVTLPALLLTLVGVGAAIKESSPTYRATGSIVLLAPPETPTVDGVPTDASGQNAYARSFGDLSIMADVLARIMTNDDTRADLLDRGVTDYDVVANEFDRGPVIEVTGESTSSAAAVESTQAVLDDLDEVLVQVQQQDANADPTYFITSDPLQSPTDAVPQYSSTVRAVIAVSAVGVLLTLGLAVLAENVHPRARGSRTGATDVTSEPPDAAPPGHLRGAPSGPDGAPTPSPSEEAPTAGLQPLRWSRAENGHVRWSRTGNGHPGAATKWGT